MNGHVPMSTRLLRIEPNANCEGGMMLGLTHQRLNLECALQLATLVGRKLQVAPLQEHRHTRCARRTPPRGRASSASRASPRRRRRTRFAARGGAPRARHHARWSRVRNSPRRWSSCARPPRDVLHYYQACIALPASADGFPPVPSNSVRAAARDARASAAARTTACTSARPTRRRVDGGDPTAGAHAALAHAASSGSSTRARARRRRPRRRRRRRRRRPPCTWRRMHPRC